MENQKFMKIGPMRLPCLLANGEIVNFNLYTYRFPEEKYYYVIEKGNVKKTKNPLVRIHSACSFAHVFSSQRCDCKYQLDAAMLRIAESGGLIIYAWSHEGRGVGFWDHTRVYMEQDKGEDTVSSYEVLGLPVDQRDYSDAIEILKDYGLKKIKLLTNNPKKVEPVQKAGIQVTRIPLIARLSEYNESQIKTKIEKLGHYYDIEEARKKQGILIFDGVRGLKFALEKMLKELSPNGIYCVFASGNMAKTMGSYYDIFQKNKAKNKIKSLILYNAEIKNKKELLKKTKGIKKFYPITHFLTDTFIYNDKVLIVVWEATPPFAILIINKESAETYKNIFDVFWKGTHT